MTGLLETLIAWTVSVAVIAVLVALALCYLLTRQVVRVRPLRTMLVVLGFTLVGGPIGLLIGLGVAAVLQRRWSSQLPAASARPAPAGLARPWAGLVGDAAAARERFCQTVEGLADGPLRDGLRDIRHDVDRALAEARRLAEQGDRTQRAHRDIERTLDAQRRRARRSGAKGGGLTDPALQSSIQAQHASAERLAAAARRDLNRLQVVVARLHELTAHALELSTISRTTELEATTSITDRVAALRVATAEVEQAAHPARL